MFPQRLSSFSCFFAPFVALIFLPGVQPTAAAADVPAKKKIVLIAGKKSHGPVGNGIHDYGWSVQLLKVMLDNSNVKDRVTVEIHLDGWPRDPKTLEDAHTIMIISDGRDGDKFEEAPHLASEERVRFIEKQIKRGCGFLTFHFSTFAGQKHAEQMLDWSGGYFQWETDGKRQWYSAITTTEAEVQLGTPAHPIARGLKPLKMREEFYYNIRFKAKDDSLKPIWVVPALKGREPDGSIVAWARQRPDGGRGFGTTVGHFYDNWKQDQFRKMILNAIVWTAKLEVPEGGVEAKFYTHDEIKAVLDGKGAQGSIIPLPRELLAPGRIGKALDDGVPGIADDRQPASRTPSGCSPARSGCRWMWASTVRASSTMSLPCCENHGARVPSTWSSPTAAAKLPASSSAIRSASTRPASR